ncbi:2112_t:CDS:2 [Entrophospora sp. SA101]|nr:5055_t:CDS:2 [Entrophospora sp. SA101]CAJ0833905.1 2112_t:CDS:2 [Entrophospora sp. SA101]CAJ0887121.1 7884_t:CDS:2 [Entrophospora sp. SA101]
MVEEKVQDKLSTTSGPNIGNSKNMFDVTFSCGVSDAVLCNKVKTAFMTAGEIISSSLILNTVVTVNATFTDFCAQNVVDCTTQSGFVTLGGASPARTIFLQDDDGFVRLYPQALVKQFQFPKHPGFGPFDIFAMFNSVGSKYWFQGDPPITPDQQDFLYVVLHEMVHGLGFSSNWLNDFSDGMTPQASLSGTDPNAPLVFLGFIESAFDKYMINIPKGTRISASTDQLNKFSGKPIPINTGLPFKNQDDFVNAFTSSPNYKLAQNMLTLSTTPNSLGFLPHDTNKADDSIVLETSLTPFQPGSSVSHVDYKTYNNTSDFLMKFLADRGTDLNTLITIRSANKTDQNDLRLAISPKLILLLETLGYTTPNHPNPYKPTIDITSNSLNSTDNSIQPGSTAATNTDNANNTKSDSMIIKPNLILTFTLIILSISIKSKYWP